jgi:hypothetical protein
MSASQSKTIAASVMDGDAAGSSHGPNMNLTVPQKERRRALVVPREHGAWGMLLIPLVTGAGIGLLSGGRAVPVLLLATAVLAVFWLRTPAESWLGTGAVRAQTVEERRHVRNFVVPLAAIALGALSALFWRGENLNLIMLGLIAGPAFAMQIYLQKMGRATRMAAEVVGALALTSTAPAAYCVATGQMDANAWALWGVNWIFAGDQIHFVWLRICGMRAAGWTEKLRVGWSFLAGQVVLVVALAVAYRLTWLRGWAVIAFAPILLRGCVWFATKPKPIVIRRLGQVELFHAISFGILLVFDFAFLGRL